MAIRSPLTKISTVRPVSRTSTSLIGADPRQFVASLTFTGLSDVGHISEWRVAFRPNPSSHWLRQRT
jgi:hypothetical protein